MQAQRPMGHWVRLCAARALEGCVCLHAWKGGNLHGYCTIVVSCWLRMAPLACTAHMVVGTWLGGSYLHLNPEEGSTENGFGNLEVGAKYQLITLTSAEALFSFGLTAEVGGTGARSVGADSVSTLSPSIFFGKGFGDLPETVPFLRPFALTGAFAANIPTRKQTVTTQVDPLSGELSQETELHPITFSWGLTLQYNLQYLQTFVKDVGLGVPFNRMIPLIEFPMETCLNRGCGGQTTGTINPGIIWF